MKDKFEKWQVRRLLPVIENGQKITRFDKVQKLTETTMEPFQAETLNAGMREQIVNQEFEYFLKPGENVPDFVQPATVVSDMTAKKDPAA